MKITASLPKMLLAAFVAVLTGCSGSSGSGDAATSEAGVTADGPATRLDGKGMGLDGATASQLDGGLSAPDTIAVNRDGALDAIASGADLGTALGVDATIAKLDVGRDLGPVASTDSAIRSEGGTVVTVDAPVATKDSGPDLTSGNAIVDRMGAASAACGPQSWLTVPAGWQMVFAGEQGCAFYAPAGWLTPGAGTPMTFAIEDESKVTGSSVMAGVDLSGTATCTPHGVANWLFSLNKDCVGFKELFWTDGVDVVAGLQIPRGNLVYSCTQGGTPVAGYMVVQIHGTWPLCNILAVTFWLPETQIEARTCTLTQTLHSLQCPQGGGTCSDATCRQECIADGNTSGACTSGGTCQCTH